MSGSNSGSDALSSMEGTTRKTAILMTAALLAATTLHPAAMGMGFGFNLAPVYSYDPSSPREYPYPAEPQYQYPRTDGRAEMKCPKGQKPFQGKCRKARPVH